jgi:hypothetical protein
MNKRLWVAALGMSIAGMTWAGSCPEQGEGKRGKPPGFEELDTNGDGGIDMAEADAFRPLVKGFPQLDEDGDGMVSEAEMPQHPHRGGKPLKGRKLFKKLDTDENGSLSQNEVEDFPRLADNFATIDTDADGSLSKRELKSFKRNCIDRQPED